MYCTKCGAENDQQSVVCRNCGERLLDKKAFEEASVEAVAEAAPVEEVKPAPKKRKWLRAISMLVAMITLLLMFGDAFKLTSEVTTGRTYNVDTKEHELKTEDLTVEISPFTLMDMLEFYEKQNDMRGVEYSEEAEDQLEIMNLCFTTYKICFAMLLLAFAVMLFMAVAETKGIVVSSIVFNSLAAIGNLCMIGGIVLIDLVTKTEGLDIGFGILPVIALVLSIINILYVILLRKQIKR